MFPVICSNCGKEYRKMGFPIGFNPSTFVCQNCTKKEKSRLAWLKFEQNKLHSCTTQHVKENWR